MIWHRILRLCKRVCLCSFHNSINSSFVSEDKIHCCVCVKCFKDVLYDPTAAEFSSEVSFQGDGYVELSNSLLPHKTPTENEVITIEFSTTEPNGLIFWHGQTPDTDGRTQQDYVALAGEWSLEECIIVEGNLYGVCHVEITALFKKICTVIIPEVSLGHELIAE